MTVFNQNVQGHRTGKYPLFFGEDLGLFDTVNLIYPQFEELYQKQLAQIWNEFEIDLTQDRMDMRNVDKGIVDLMVNTIGWQHLADSVAERSLSGLILPHVTNSELEGMVQIQAFFEVIHSRTYSHIVKQTFTDPSDMLERTYKDVQTLVRSKVIIEAFDALDAITKDTPIEEKRVALLTALAALIMLEGVAFMASFAVTFAIAELDVFQGISALVTLICRDEVLHTRMDYEVFKVLMKDPEWKDAFQVALPKIREVFDNVVQQEVDWSHHLFSEDRQIVGLNADLLEEYVYFMAEPIYNAIGVPFKFQVVEENPLPYMDKYIDSSSIQSAAQEIQLTNYHVGAIEDDGNDDLDFNFD